MEVSSERVLKICPMINYIFVMMEEIQIIR